MAGEDAYRRFAAAYDAGRAQILFRRVVADLETPVGTYLKLAEGRQNTFLLESVQDGATRGRYSMIGLLPDIILKVEDGKASINRNAGLEPDAFDAGRRSRRSRRCAASSPKARSRCPRACRRPPPASTAISATTWSGMMEVLPDRNPDAPRPPRCDPDAAVGACDLRYAQGRALPHRAGLCARRRHRPAGL